MKRVNFSLYVCIRGEVEVEETPNSPFALIHNIFPNGWEGEIDDICTSPQFLPKGYMDVYEMEKEDDE